MIIRQAETAINHYKSGNISKSKQATKILLAMADGGEYTIGELAYALGMEKSTISARRRELLDREWVTYGENRKCHRSGVMCETITINIGVKK